MIDPKHFQQVKHTVETLHLGTFDPLLSVQLAKIRPELNSKADDAIWPLLLAQYEALTAGYDATGIIRVPPAFLPDGFPVATQEGTGAITNISKKGNAILAGPSGSGKTTLLQGALLAAYMNGPKLFIADPKEDSRFWLAIDTTFVTIDENTKINLLQRPPWRSIEEHITELVEWFRRCFYSGEQQGAVLRKALTIAFATYEHPSLAQLHEIVDKLGHKSDTYSWRDAVLGVSERLHKIKQRYPVAYSTNVGLGLDWLLRQHVYLPLMNLDPVGEWVLSILLNHLFQRNKHYGIRTITTVVAIDEGIGVLSKAHAANTISGTNGLATIATMNREFGIRILFTTVDLSNTDPLILSTAATIGILPGVSEQSLRLAGLTTNQYASARHLHLGQVMFLYPGQLAWPIIATFTPLPDGLKERQPPHQPTPSTLLLLPAPAPSDNDTRDGAPTNDSTASADTRPVGLNPIEERMLRHVTIAGITTVSEMYDALSIHYQAGDRGKTKLLQLGLITATPIIARSGRGGRAIALQATTLGKERAGVKPARGTRGGKAQSEFLIQRLHQYLPDSSVETMVGHKTVDLLLRVDPVQHEQFLLALNEHSHTFNGSEPMIAPNTLVAIEVEVSAPEKTLPNNFLKDRDAGLSHILFAVMPQDLTQVIQRLQHTEEHLDGIIIIDALLLLDRLRGGGAKEDHPHV